ncbi:uncharacterized protein B0H64DRAFT_419813 [Chaetomium fimeti]|uniref:Impact N-terminal domain-containing protein n=1 Tax=Chaetomium fimeti TaxID=1854472 RepID=A0AAE0H9S3_9PEZI|nr:hypothetical protein B0H64DRAFT_419813 [Chaetomium fimeti]
MATQQDLQELLRLITVGRKTPMMQAMTQIKALQAAELRSIKQIAEAPLETVQSTLKDEKGGRALHNACKAVLKRGPSAPNKRGAPDAVTPQTKRTKTNPFMAEAVDTTPQALEKSLELPLCMDEERISNSVIETNRAPLVLAFAVEVLRHTMPEQPLSSRLSLGQAVVSANSRSKAVSLGVTKGPSADEEGWGEGQPRVKVLGREIAVLKRGGYEWKGEEVVGEQDVKADAGTAEANTSASGTQVKIEETTPLQPTPNKPPSKPTWATSQPITLKDSTFVARATHMSEPSQRKALVQSLLTDVPHLQTATHNAWAYRLRPPRDAFSAISRAHEESFDDGETGCGDLMLRAMRDAGAVDTLVVLTRWFGGTMLGPDRWRLMRNCVAAALGERLRRPGAEVTLGGEALWGLDLEATRAGKTVVGGYGSGVKMHAATGVVGMQVHRPEQARAYLLRSFGSATTAVAGAQGEGAAAAGATAAATGKSPKKAKTLKAMEVEKEENLGLLLGALRIVFDSWAGHIGAAELDRRAWGW